MQTIQLFAFVFCQNKLLRFYKTGLTHLLCRSELYRTHGDALEQLCGFMSHGSHDSAAPVETHVKTPGPHLLLLPHSSFFQACVNKEIVCFFSLEVEHLKYFHEIFFPPFDQSCLLVSESDCCVLSAPAVLSRGQQGDQLL